MSRDESIRNAYALVGEIISASVEIEIELLYVSLELSDGSMSVSHMWHRLSGFHQRIDFTDVVVELGCGTGETRRFWYKYKKLLLELNAVRNHIAHGAIHDGDDSSAGQPRSYKFHDEHICRTVSIEDIEEARVLLREALELGRWFHIFIATYKSEAQLREARERVEELTRRATAVKDRQQKVNSAKTVENHRRSRVASSDSPTLFEELRRAASQ